MQNLPRPCRVTRPALHVGNRASLNGEHPTEGDAFFKGLNCCGSLPLLPVRHPENQVGKSHVRVDLDSGEGLRDTSVVLTREHENEG